MKPSIGHKMILASAGSGKTFTLVNRYIHLLAAGINPARIMALTFTRKAAGEFLQKIFLRLMEAASDEKTAAQLSSHIGRENESSVFYESLLIRLVREMGSLQLGTIDSFFARVVGGFPYELGLTGPHRILDEFEQGVAREEALDRLLSTGDEERTGQILQLYKELTWGAEEKQVYGLFDDKFQRYHSVYLENREISLWGVGDRIFKSKPWWMNGGPEITKLIEEIRRDLSVVEMKPSMAAAFARLLEEFSLWQPGQPVKGGKLFDDLLTLREELAGGQAAIDYRRALTDITPPLSTSLHKLLQAYVSQEVGRRLVITHSLGQLLREFDMLYDRYVREGGSLVFADLPMLLIKGLCDEPRAIQAEDILYRLDGQTDHWLIDEFQDTSRIQWKVLSAFVDEILQDTSGERSFFYVGDVKQSIYTWRGGDSRLFDEIVRRYNKSEAVIQTETLNHSWRSAPPVLDFVNTLFGSGIDPGQVGAEAANRWNGLWHQHLASPRTDSLEGYAGWGLVAEGSVLEDACVELIRTTDPLGHRLSCAILMRRNKDVVSMTQALRKAGIPASMEGVVRIAVDNILGTWIRAFLYSLARPEEQFPADYTSLPGFELDERSRRSLTGEVRKAITHEGYAEAVRDLLDFASHHLPPHPFLTRRSEQLLEAATRFDGTGMSSLEGFIAFLEAATVQESTLSTQVQVMTVHKAKGLDFDQVIVAGFGGDPIVRPNNRDLHIQRGSTGEVEWILDLPVKRVVEQDPILNAASEEAKQRDVFESLCLLYVAMTRARRGLYCLAEKPGRNSRQATWHGIFETAFSSQVTVRAESLIEWQKEWGSADWQSRADSGAVEEAGPVVLSPIGGDLPPVRPMLRRASSPSMESHAVDAPARELRSPEGRRFGTRMHDYLATIEWIDFSSARSLQSVLAAAPELIRERIAAFLDTSLARGVFERPGTPCELWREKPYILRRQSTISSGIIDRAVIYLGPSGAAVRAVILDFKTDSLDPGRPAGEQLLERYAVQVERYREAVGLLTGLPESEISTRLIPV